jgi:hypothetical protein
MAAYSPVEDQDVVPLVIDNTPRSAIEICSIPPPPFRKLVRRQPCCQEFTLSQLAIRLSATKPINNIVVELGKSPQDLEAMIAKPLGDLGFVKAALATFISRRWRSNLRTWGGFINLDF